MRAQRSDARTLGVTRSREVHVAEIPVQPKRQRGGELPVEPKRRRSVWPWVLGLLALVLLPLLLLRRDRDETATIPDTSAFVDTTTRFGGRTTGTAAGAVAADTSGAPRTGTGTRRDTAARGDTTVRGDTATRIDTTRR
jgi:hypothetical protein